MPAAGCLDRQPSSLLILLFNVCGFDIKNFDIHGLNIASHSPTNYIDTKILFCTFSVFKITVFRSKRASFEDLCCLLVSFSLNLARAKKEKPFFLKYEITFMGLLKASPSPIS